MITCLQLQALKEWSIPGIRFPSLRRQLTSLAAFRILAVSARCLCLKLIATTQIIDPTEGQMGLEFCVQPPACTLGDPESEGCMLAEEGDFHGAIRCFRKAVNDTEGQSKARMYEMMAQCMMECGSNEEAVVAASRATVCDSQVLRQEPHMQ